MGSGLAPKEIDKTVLAKAINVRERIKRAEPRDDTEFEPVYDEFVAATDPFQDDAITLAAAPVLAFGPDVPVIDVSVVKVGQKKLLEIVPFDKPVTRSGRSTFHIDPEAMDGGDFIPADWVMVSALFEVEKQSERQALEYGPRLSEVVFARTELQRRARRADGRWSDDDWTSVRLYPAEPERDPPALQFEMDEQEGRLVHLRDSRNALGRFFNNLRDSAVQRDLIRPQPLVRRDGTAWTNPGLVPRHELAMMDHEYLYPGQPVKGDPDYIYPDAPTDAVIDVGADESPAEVRERKLDAARAYLESARKTCSSNDANRAHNEAFDVANDQEASRREKTNAERLMQDSNHLLADIALKLLPSCRAAQDSTDGERDEEEMARWPRQVIWAHDAAPGSIVNGKTYQYRMRVWLYNRLAGEPQEFADAADAEQVLIPGPWSEPTDPITIEPAVMYFVTGSDESRNQVRVEVFQWFVGVWVKHAIKKGLEERVADGKTHAVPSISVEGEIQYPTVPFDAEVTILDIEHNRPHRERDRSGRSGVKFEEPSAACAAVFVDAEGHLHERFLPTDKAHPSKGTLAKERVFRAPRRSERP